MNAKANIHTISILVANKPGVLVRVALVFSRRGYNIDSLVVSPAFDERFSRMTITAQGDPATLEQIIKQVSKLIDVLHACEHSELDAVTKELALFKIKIPNSGTKSALTKLMNKHGASIIEQTDDVLIISQIGDTEQVDEFETILSKYNIIELVRSGKLVMAKGTFET
jgi:acetolactate synthase-1/3 small subunit